MNPSSRELDLLAQTTGSMPAVQWAEEEDRTEEDRAEEGHAKTNRPFSLVHQRLAERSMRHTPVGELMTTQVKCVGCMATVHEAARIMQGNDYACIVVVEQGSPVGIVTEKDMIRILSGVLSMPPSEKLTIGGFMSAPPLCLGESASLYDALELAQSRDLGQIPVVDDADRVVGLLLRESIAEAHLAAVEQERDAIEEQIRNRSRELSQANRELKALALQDGLLKIGNRRAMELDLYSIHFNAIRYRQSYALGLVDVDFFKRYNDCYGHCAGDRVLVAVANGIKQSIRRGDRVYRYGGEEFLVVMPETSLQEALEAIQRLAKNLAGLDIEHRESPHGRLTISAGVSAFAGAGDTDSWEAVVEEADALLYRAKELGRDQVASQPIETESPRTVWSRQSTVDSQQ